MNNQTPTHQTATVHYTAPRPVNIGDVFYKIERDASKSFYEPCRVCGDKRKLTVNGVTFACPCCNTGKQAITVHSYAVRRYRVFCIKSETGTNDWKPSNYRDTEFSAYRKVGGGHYYDNGGTIRFLEYDFQLLYNKSFNGDAAHHEGIYDDYKTALSVAAQMNESEIDRLIAYNNEHGTNHAVDFAPKHDPKG